MLFTVFTLWVLDKVEMKVGSDQIRSNHRDKLCLWMWAGIMSMCHNRLFESISGLSVMQPWAVLGIRFTIQCESRIRVFLAQAPAFYRTKQQDKEESQDGKEATLFSLSFIISRSHPKFIPILGFESLVISAFDQAHSSTQSIPHLTRRNKKKKETRHKSRKISCPVRLTSRYHQIQSYKIGPGPFQDHNAIIQDHHASRHVLLYFSCIDDVFLLSPSRALSFCLSSVTAG
jgi:hypothetical protein